MRRVSRGAEIWALVAAFLCFSAAPSALGEVSTVGSPMSAPPTTRLIFKSGLATVANMVLSEPDAHVTSPISGTIVRWRLAGNTFGGPFTLRVLREGGNPSAGERKYKKVGETPGVFASGLAQTIPASLPIQAGDLIALDVSGIEPALGFTKVPGSEAYSALWSDFTGQAADATADFLFASPEREFGFNADVQPPPRIEGLSPAQGSVSGGTTVVLQGSDFEGATSVTFGGLPAQSFSVNSPSQIAAVSPANASLATIPITVVTPAGTATSPNRFAYQGCLVPDVSHRQLRAARKLIKANLCAMGHARKRGPRKGKVARVISQQPSPGSVVPFGSKVSPTLSRPKR
jgi:IPT/TIG domain